MLEPIDDVYGLAEGGGEGEGCLGQKDGYSHRCPVAAVQAPRQRSSGSMSEYSDFASTDSELEEIIIATEVGYRQEISKEAERAVRNYVFLSLFHVAVFEGPVAVVEAFARSAQQLILALLYLVFGLGRKMLCCRHKRHLKRAGQRFTDSLLFFFAAFTLALPAGAALFVYRDLYDAWAEGRLRRSSQGKESWILRDVPTVVGPLEAQRLTVFKNGQGFYSHVAHGSPQEHRSLILV